MEIKAYHRHANKLMRILPQQVDWLELEGSSTTVINAETVQRESQIAARREVVQDLPTREQVMSIIVTVHPLTPPFLASPPPFHPIPPSPLNKHLEMFSLKCIIELRSKKSNITSYKQNVNFSIE